METCGHLNGFQEQPAVYQVAGFSLDYQMKETGYFMTAD
jgi:hypothetical protein